MGRVTWPAKDPAERFRVRFRFGNRLADGETITVAMSITVASGADATPSAVLDGAVSVSGGDAWQWVKDGVDGTAYAIRALATTSTGQKLVAVAILPVNAA